MVTLLTGLGYKQFEGAGSRVKFIKDDVVIDLHKPHPGNELKLYVRKLVLSHLKKRGDI